MRGQRFFHRTLSLGHRARDLASSLHRSLKHPAAERGWELPALSCRCARDRGLRGARMQRVCHERFWPELSPVCSWTPSQTHFLMARGPGPRAQPSRDRVYACLHLAVAPAPAVPTGPGLGWGVARQSLCQGPRWVGGGGTCWRMCLWVSLCSLLGRVPGSGFPKC